MDGGNRIGIAPGEARLMVREPPLDFGAGDGRNFPFTPSTRRRRRGRTD
jgi:hypothetical protein